jgi:membrane-associated phospholipid phosphatase
VSRETFPAARAALACVIGLAITGALAYLSPVAHVRDSATLHGFVSLDRPRLTPILDHVAHLADPAPYALVGLALTALAVARGRWRVAVAIPLILLGAAVTTELLKPLLAHPRPSEWLGKGQVAAASWPSGHATAAMTLGLCGVLAVPAALRPAAAAAGALFAVAVSYAILALGWHFPSDVIGGFFVAGLWASLGIWALRRAEVRKPAPPERRRGPTAVETTLPLALVGAATLLAGGIALDRPHAVAAYAHAHPTFVFGAAAIAALAALLAGAASRAATPIHH